MFLFIIFSIFSVITNSQTPLHLNSDCISKQCIEAPFILEKTGEVSCEAREDCCGCQEIICKKCNQITCNNKRSCVGAKIVLQGQKTGGQLSCNGQNGCLNTNIFGSNIIDIDCSAKYSCKQANMNLNNDLTFPTNLEGIRIRCDEPESCISSLIQAKNIRILSCRETYSCEQSIGELIGGNDGLKIDCHGRISCSNNLFNVQNLKQLFCTGAMSCTKTKINGNCIGNGCIIECNERSACVSTNIILNNVKTLDCMGTWACIYGEFNIKGVNNNKGLKISCWGDNACGETIINATNVNDIDCIGTKACFDATMNLDESKGGALICHGSSSCKNANINGLTNIESIVCQEKDACYKTVITGVGDRKLGTKITCMDHSSCLFSTMQLTHISSIVCSETYSCGQSNFDISVFDESFSIRIMGARGAQFSKFNIKVNDNISHIKNIQCGEQSACELTTFNIDASNARRKIYIGSIQCVFGGCRETVFRLTNAVIKKENINCGYNSDTVTCLGVNFQCIQNGVVVSESNCVI